MNNKSYVLVGMFFGDEGKGTFGEYTASSNNIKNFVRYNGGSQASHTVVTKEGKIHKFSQLGSGSFIDGSKTYLSANTVVSPINLLEEIIQFSNKVNCSKEELLQRVYIDKNSYIVTPYHKLIKRLRELSNLYPRIGSVGTGVSEVLKLLNEEDLGIQMKYFNVESKNILKEKLLDLYHFTKTFLMKNEKHIDDINSYIDEREIKYLTSDQCKYELLDSYLDLMKSNKFNVVDSFNEFYNPNGPILFEASQGTLLDRTYGIKPNTTYLDTTNNYAIEMLKSVNNDNYSKIGLIKAFASRHGMGVLPTETKELNIEDNNQTCTYWNGFPRYGWFDAVLTRYSNSINNVDELYISSIDQVSNYERIKICNSYLYLGEIDEEFKNMFEYQIIEDKAYITNIKNNNGDISKYLYTCKPTYIEIDGWMKEVRNIKDIDKLPINCIKYINFIQNLVNIPISLISLGPTKEDKVKVR